MRLTLGQLAGVAIACLVVFAVSWFVGEALPKRFRTAFRMGIIGVVAAGFFFALNNARPGGKPINYKRVTEISKTAIAMLAAIAVFYEGHRNGQSKPISERWKRLIGITLALAAIFAYFNGFKFGYPKYYHRWDQYHYYMGAKYYPELGYKGLYKCAVVAQDELGPVKYRVDRVYGSDDPGRELTVDMSKEMRDPDKKIRDLPGENLLIPVKELIANPAQCTDRFSKERWEEYKSDVAFYRIVSGKQYWTDMQKDHGYNPPPVWSIGGGFFSDLSPASVRYLQFLASLDILYIIGMFVALWWGFGWRVFAVGAIFWGCQASAPFYWTGGAFLRQDWLFFSVLSVACIRKRHFKIAGAALVYGALLRIFPGLVVFGTLVPTVAHIIKKRSMHPDHKQMLIGGTLAAALLLPLSVAMTDKDSYRTFYEHTIGTHDKTPLTNHMGLRVIVGHKVITLQKPGIRSAEEREAWRKTLSPSLNKAIGWSAAVRLPLTIPSGKESGHMQHVRDNSLDDPFKIWKDLRNERNEKLKYVKYGIVLGSFILFWIVVSRIKSLWIAQCLGQIFIILGSQLTCYYYSFMILGAPLIKARRQLELGLFATAVLTQVVFMNTTFNDNRYTLLTYISLIFCYVMLGLFYRKHPEQAEVDDPAFDEIDDDGDEEFDGEEDMGEDLDAEPSLG